ncbi:hypothetical protein BDZ89DRAFT_1157904 [Hymenopellis radicata]|nr:hypothetical protein BDZ89DRAFT_1157904 [Hymenopellis radicata]
MPNNGQSYYPCPPLPQEIIDLIIEQLGFDGDTKSLFACLTVSNAFLPMARACLWRDRFLGPYRCPRMLYPVKWSIDKIPESPVLRSLVRSVRICAENWSLGDPNKFWEDFSVVVDALQRVDHVELDSYGLGHQVVCPPVIRKWHILSLKVSRLPIVTFDREFECTAKSCTFFENFPVLTDLELEEDGFLCFIPRFPRCTMERHHNLPSPTSLTLRKLRRHADNICTAILAGHLVSLKRLRTLEIVDSFFKPESLLTVVSNTIKELNIDYTEYETPLGRWEPFSFGTTEVIIFSVDAMHGPKVTIEIQLYLERDVTAPKIRFPKVWKELGKALLGLRALKHLVIIHRLGYTDRIRERKDAVIRAGVTKFLRRELSDVTSSGHVRLTVIDRNVV